MAEVREKQQREREREREREHSNCTREEILSVPAAYEFNRTVVPSLSQALSQSHSVSLSLSQCTGFLLAVGGRRARAPRSQCLSDNVYNVSLKIEIGA